MSPILLDTHAVIWTYNGTVSDSVRKVIDAATARGELLISTITAWEIATLAGKNRITLGAPLHEYIRALFNDDVVHAAVTPEIASAAGSLPTTFTGDPADRIIIATAQAYRAHLVTRDKQIHGFARATRTFQCIPC
jgi:PIN domain nuclease of toxin-antitoxin system